ncbi:MAG: DUF4097 family beta strand repeat protein [Bacilli bacterium]|nr:DUF4097 family beta strand repeat protein [Bacilli bacterium]
MKSRGLTIFLIVLLFIIAVGLSGGLAFLLIKGNNFNFSFNIGNSKMEVVDSLKVNYTDVAKIILNLSSTDIEIKESTDEMILIEYQSNQDNNGKIEYKDNIIIIDEEKANLSCVGFCNSNRKIVLYIPEYYDNEYDLTTTSGDILSNIDFNKATISSNSGDISLKEVNNIKINTTSGDIKLTNINNAVNITTISGDILIDKMMIKDNSSIKTTSGDVIISDNQSVCYIETKTTSGDVSINNNNRKSDIVLDIKTTSGDISVS